MRTAAILPVKRFTRAKQRLGASVADPLRLALARAMVADVLLALAQTDAIERTIVVTGERSIVAAAHELGATIIEDAHEHGQSAAAELGVERAIEDGFERVLCVPGDCPTLDPAELGALLGAHNATELADDAGTGREPPRHVGILASGRSERTVVIVPDRHGAGTNGLLLTPPDVISPSFGPESCARHRALALAAGAICRVEQVRSLLLDIDTGADLEVLRVRASEDLGAGHPTRALRTRAVLGQHERTDGLSVTSSA